MSLNRHLNRLSTASPRHKGWAAAPQLWALRYYPAALQLNYLYSAFIMRSQTSKNIEALFFMPFHNSQFTIHKSQFINRTEFYSHNNTSYFPIMLSKLALPGPTKSKVI